MAWLVKKLGDVAEIIVGKTPAQVDYANHGNYKVLKYRDITRNTVDWTVDDKGFVKERMLKGLKEVHIGDLLITSAGHSSEKIGEETVVIREIPEQFEKVFFVSELICYRTNQNILDPEWLLFFLLSDAGQVQLKKIIGDSVHLTKEKSEMLEIPLPPIEEQRRIVKKLETLMAKIDEAKKLRELALQDSAALLPAALHQIFSRAEEEGWEEKSLGEISVLTRGPFGGSLKKSIFVDKGYKVYEQKNAIYNDFTIGKYFVTKEKFKEMERFAISSEDLIMSCSGTIGRVAIVPDDAQLGIINQALLKISPIKNVVLNSYLKCVLESPILQERIFGNVLGAAIKNIAGVKILKEIKIPLPSIAEQKKIVAHFDLLSEKVRDLRELQQQTQAELNKLSQSILHAAFSGKL